MTVPNIVLSQLKLEGKKASNHLLLLGKKDRVIKVTDLRLEEDRKATEI